MEEYSYFSANPPGLIEKLKSKYLFIAGAGGLGSNVAMMLVRAGLLNISVVDFDVIESSNINRQFYFRDQINQPKVYALKDNLLRINPNVNINAIEERITEENIDKIIPQETDILLECFDCAVSKAMFARFALKNYPEVPTITVSGLAGVHSLDLIKKKSGPGKLIIIGDCRNEATIENGTLSSRVMYAASMQAHEAIRLLMA
jgi:sulfur carrier protein ThiS adenylyltransferase